MKIFILIISFILVVYTNALDQALIDKKIEKIMEYGAECVEIEHPTQEDIEALHNHQAPKTHAGRCLIFCVKKKLNVMNEDGTINDLPHSEWMDQVKINDPEVYENMKKVYHNCANSVEIQSDGCDTAFELMHCFKTESKKLGLDKVFAPED